MKQANRKTYSSHNRGHSGNFCELRRIYDLIAIYGGAAGGGKTWALLMEAARHIRNPIYNAVIFRRTTPQITNAKGLWDKALQMYPGLKGVPKQNPNYSFNWRSGARIEFRHLQHDTTVYDYQGAEIDFIGYDELTHFSEKQFWYMLSRNRSLSGVKPYVRATCNPAPGWVKELIAAWVDPNHANKAQSGEVRYFIRKDGEIVWVAPGYVDDEGIPAKSLTFIAADIYDNKILLEKDPGYLANLKAQPIIDQERLLRGNWNVFEGAFFAEFSETAHSEQITITPETLPKNWECFSGNDWGYASPFVNLFCAVDETGVVHVLDEIYQAKLEDTDQALRVAAKYKEWGKTLSQVPLVYDPAMGSRGREEYGAKKKSPIENYQNEGLVCVKGNNDRAHGLSQIRSFLHHNKLKINKARCPNLIREFQTAVFDEKNAEDMDSSGSDHALDALRYFLMTRPRPSLPSDYAELAAEERRKQKRRAELFGRDDVGPNFYGG